MFEYEEFVCITTSENNNKQYLVSYFYKHVAFIKKTRVFFIKELADSVRACHSAFNTKIKNKTKLTKIIILS